MTPDPAVPEVPIPAAAYDEALALCNARRADAGLTPWDKLPAGVAMNATKCPCAQSVPGLVVPGSAWWINNGASATGGPASFVRAFDRAVVDACVPNRLALPVRTP